MPVAFTPMHRDNYLTVELTSFIKTQDAFCADFTPIDFYSFFPSLTESLCFLWCSLVYAVEEGYKFSTIPNKCDLSEEKSIKDRIK